MSGNMELMQYLCVAIRWENEPRLLSPQCELGEQSLELH